MSLSLSRYTTPTASFVYDLSSVDGYVLSNTVGRLVRSSTGGTYPTANYYNYDSVGRILNRGECVYINNCGSSNPTLWTVTNTYDLAGDLTGFSDANGTAFTQAFDAAGRPTTLTSNLVDATHPATLLSVDPTAGYFPSGALKKATLGNGLIETFVFNSTLEPCRVATNSTGTPPASCADSNSGNVLDLSYGYNSGSTNNGNVASWVASGQQSFNRSFSYDSLNRIATMSQSSGAANGCGSAFGLSWTIDPWGNRTDQNVTSGTCNAFHQAVGTNNRLSSGSYDAAGNLLADGLHAYTYDAENRIFQVDSGSTAIYVYDADGRRAAKSLAGAITFYIYGADGQVVSERDTNNLWNQTYIHFGGNLVAIYRGAATGFLHKDHLGSTRLVTLSDKSVYDTWTFSPSAKRSPATPAPRINSPVTSATLKAASITPRPATTAALLAGS